MIYEVIITDCTYFVNAKDKREALLYGYELHLKMLNLKFNKYPFGVDYIENVLAKIEKIEEIIELIHYSVTINKI